MKQHCFRTFFYYTLFYFLGLTEKDWLYVGHGMVWNKAVTELDVQFYAQINNYFPPPLLFVLSFLLLHLSSNTLLRQEAELQLWLANQYHCVT